MCKRTPTLLLLTLITVMVRAQGNIPFDRDHIADKVALDNALRAMHQADKLAETGGAAYAQALPLYLQAHAVNPDNADLNVRIGLCHLNGEQRPEAVEWFLRAAALDPAMPRVHFLCGYALQLNGRWDEAIAEYEDHKVRTARNPDPEPAYNQADKHLAECRNGKALTAAPAHVRVSNMGSRINSPESDYGVLLTADGGTLFYTSRRANSTGGKVNKATNEYFEDVYVSTRGDQGWSDPAPLPEPVNTAINDASVGLFNDGRTMLIYRDVKGTGDLFETKRTGKAWSDPRPLGPNVNTRYHESSAWYSFDRQWLYFVSDRPEEGLGAQDIYRSKWDAATKEWGPAENLGPTINTRFDEDGIFVHPDGRTIYFSSKGHNSMGGYDIFRSTLEGGQWSKPVNLGWPVNGADDDLFFVMNASGSTGYFSSLRPGGLGEDDIYEVEFLPDPAAQETATAAAAVDAAPTNTMATVLVKGWVKDLRALKGLEADIDLLDLADASLVARFQSDRETGEFMATVPAGRAYALHVRANGYLFHSQHIEVGAVGTVELALEVGLKPLEAGGVEVMRNLFFDRDKADLQPGSHAELAQLMKLMTDNPGLRLEVGGHTDSDGSAEHNLKLSQARAQAVVDHLTAQGIAADRLEVKGYGPTQPMAPNDSAANKARNRRTEIRILGQ
ncbi:MAG: OmpA family protein [Flavobacteriales bacterium]|nr:OmpA family protein [Flavobacteriales bacterium]